MTTPEGYVKTYLVRRIRALGGDVRFVRWIGRNGAPDTLIGLPGASPTLVETKAPSGAVDPHQTREFRRLQSWGFRVLVLATPEAIDHEFPAPASSH